jgi:hypothetical protein
VSDDDLVCPWCDYRGEDDVHECRGGVFDRVDKLGQRSYGICFAGRMSREYARDMCGLDKETRK